LSESTAPAVSPSLDPSGRPLRSTRPGAGNSRAGRSGTVPPVAGVLTAYLTLLRWQLAQLGPMIPLVAVIQLLLAGGIVVGFGFLLNEGDTASATFLSTGTPTVLLLTLGLVIVPQGVAAARANGTLTYLRAQPVPRLVLFLADLTLWVLVALPSVVVAGLAAWWRFDVEFSFDWPLLIAGVLLVTVMATSVGYAIAVTLPTMLAQVISQVMVFFVLMFSPVTFPVERLPDWYAGVHEVLPVMPAGDVIRAGLVSGTYSAAGQDLLVLAVWAAAGVGLTLLALMRRK
jgi:ABC-2 type transport system permease protein